MRAQDSVFERHPGTTLAVFWLAFLLLFFLASEIALRQLTGLGRPVLFQAHPAYGYRMKPNQETWRFGGAHFKINNLGLRAQRDWDSSREGKILFLGDSVTYGGNRVSNEELFSEVAAARLPAFEAGNAGIPNWGVENVHGLVVGAQFLPASVYVSTFIEGDFYRGLDPGLRLPWVRYEPPLLALEELADFVWHKYVIDTQQSNRRVREADPPDVRMARGAAKLQAMDAYLKDRGFPHFIFISPTLDEVLGDAPRDPKVHAALERLGIKAMYLLDEPIMRAATPAERRSWFQDDMHLTPKGHAVWGALIGERLAEKLPWSTPHIPAS